MTEGRRGRGRGYNNNKEWKGKGGRERGGKECEKCKEECDGGEVWRCVKAYAFEQNTKPIASGEFGHSLASINVVFGDVEQRKY